MRVELVFKSAGTRGGESLSDWGTAIWRVSSSDTVRRIKTSQFIYFLNRKHRFMFESYQSFPSYVEPLHLFHLFLPTLHSSTARVISRAATHHDLIRGFPRPTGEQSSPTAQLPLHISARAPASIPHSMAHLFYLSSALSPSSSPSPPSPSSPPSFTVNSP